MIGFDLAGHEQPAPAERTKRFVRSNVSPQAKQFSTHLSREMAAYDKLPKHIQQWLDQGPRKYSAVQIFELWDAGVHIKEADEYLPAHRRPTSWW
jgi:hypothetical protein